MYPIYGITNKIKYNNIHLWNLFFEVDHDKKSEIIDVEKEFPEILGSYIRIQTNKGFHYIFVSLFNKIEETIGFGILKDLYEKNNISIDYKHDTSYKKLKEDFKVLRISSKYGKPLPIIKKFIPKKQNKVFVMDIINFYKLDEYFVRENIEGYVRNNIKLLFPSPNRYLIKYEIGE